MLITLLSRLHFLFIKEIGNFPFLFRKKRKKKWAIHVSNHLKSYIRMPHWILFQFITIEFFSGILYFFEKSLQFPAKSVWSSLIGGKVMKRNSFLCNLFLVNLFLKKSIQFPRTCINLHVIGWIWNMFIFTEAWPIFHLEYLGKECYYFDYNEIDFSIPV